MKAVILCGGMGTRLKEETEYRPKPMVKIGDKPILWHIMKIYDTHGIKDFILCLGYRGEVIKEFFINYKYFHNNFAINLRTNQFMLPNPKDNDIEEWNILFADTGLDTMTGGRVKLIEKYLDPEDNTFLVTYGDGVANINIKELIEFHKREGRIATITGIHPGSKYGVIETEGNLIKSFNEKPTMNDLINGGFFVFERRIFEFLKEDCMMVQKTFPELSAIGELAVYRHEGIWHCLDTYKDYLVLNELWNSGKAQWKIW